MNTKHMMIAVVSGIVLTFSVPAGAVMFDFNDLTPWAEGPGGIGAYMTDLYGSTVSVSTARVGSGSWFGVEFGSDPYLFTDLGTFFTGPIEIRFRDMPIESLSFEGVVFRENNADDFVMQAFSGSTRVGRYTWNGAGSFLSGLISFSAPVDRVLFSNTLVHDVGLDDLNVAQWGQAEPANVVPVPASMALGVLGIGLVGVFTYMRKKFRS